MKTKKTTSILLAILLLLSNISLAVNFHFCEGKIAAISSVFNVEEVCEKISIDTPKTCCVKTKTQKHEDCCKDKVLDLKDNSPEIIVKSFSFQFNFPTPIIQWDLPVFDEDLIIITNSFSSYYCDVNAPPLFKLHQKLIFYA